MDGGGDPVAAFYERHPYPPPVDDLGAHVGRDENVQRAAHHLVWPRRRPDTIRSVLVAGCGTSQAVRHALRRPATKVVGVDVSATAVEHTRRLADRHGVDNLEVHLLPIERVAELGQQFDQVVCTGVLHHLADPKAALSTLRAVLAPCGAVTLMVYARYGRFGVAMVQNYCRRLGITTSAPDIASLVATLRELPLGHPLGRLLRETRDFHDDDALADALLNPRERDYTVPELLDLLTSAGLRFGRWAHQAPYLPDCGTISETPHADRIATLVPAEQFAAVELFRGTITRHTVIAFPSEDDTNEGLDFTDPDARHWIPIRTPTAIAVHERLPRGAAAALINRAHPASDLVMFVDRSELRTFDAIDGTQCISALGKNAQRLVERLWRHDLVVVDATPVPEPET